MAKQAELPKKRIVAHDINSREEYWAAYFAAECGCGDTYHPRARGANAPVHAFGKHNTPSKKRGR